MTSTRIRSEMLDYTAEHRSTQGGVITDWGFEELVENQMDASSFVAIEDYVVDEVTTEFGEFRITITARPGVTVRR